MRFFLHIVKYNLLIFAITFIVIIQIIFKFVKLVIINFTMIIFINRLLGLLILLGILERIIDVTKVVVTRIISVMALNMIITINARNIVKIVKTVAN